jgi:hypothetical protein
MGWDGDISQMGHLADRLADLAEVPSRAAKRVSGELGSLLQEEFDQGHDPYGDPWSPLELATLAKRSQTTYPPLTDTAKMRRSLQVKPMRGAGVSITIAHPAAPHQTGWSGPQGSGPARPILPARGELPADWIDVIESGIVREARRA